MKNTRFAAVLVLAGFLSGCGGGGGEGGGCSSQFFLSDPSGLWVGELVLRSSTCTGPDAGPSTLSARHEVFTECVPGHFGGEEDIELRLSDQDGRFLDEMTSYIALPDGTASFTVEGDRPMGGVDEAETSKIDYEDVRHDQARVDFTRSLSAAGRVRCTEIYSGSLARR